MPNLNRVMLMGNVTRDPELRTTPKGTAICQFGLAVNREWKNEGGERQSEATFFNCEAWGRQGETIAKYVAKGKPLYVEGRVKIDNFDDKQTGAKRSATKIVVEQFQFLGRGTEEAPKGDAPPARKESPLPTDKQPATEPDDVPF